MNSLRCIPRFSNLSPTKQGVRAFSKTPSFLADAMSDLVSLLSKATQTSTPIKPSTAPTRSTIAQIRAGLAQPRTPGSIDTRNAMAELHDQELVKDMGRQMARPWRAGDVYAPHDLSWVEARKWKVIQRKKKEDVFDMLGVNPVKHYKNLTLMSEFVTETGKIKHNSETGLRPRNQRRMAKAVRRAIGIGLMPSVYKHPEIQAKALGIDSFRSS